MVSMTGSLVALALILVPAAVPQTAADLEREKPAIVQTALDYAWRAPSPRLSRSAD